MILVPDIYQTYDQMTRKAYVGHIPETFQTYDMVCHIPGIYQNMYEMSHNLKWSYVRSRVMILDDTTDIQLLQIPDVFSI